MTLLGSRSLRALTLVLLCSGAARAQVTYSTDFELTESPISASGVWKHTGLDWTSVRTSGGLAFGTQTGHGEFDDSYAYLSGFPSDQSASGVVHLDSAIATNTTHEVEILLRWSDTAHTARGYECNFAYDGQYADIVRWNGPPNSFTYLVPTLTTQIPGGLHEGDVVAASIVGRTITTYVNGKRLLSVDDATFSDGNPGIGFFRGGPSQPLTDFAFTRFSASAVGAQPAASVPAVIDWRTGTGLALLAGAYGLYCSYRARRSAKRLARVV